MMKQYDDANLDQFSQIIHSSPELICRLQALSQLKSDAYLAAGVIRNLIWSHLHQRDYMLSGTEIDVIYHDPQEHNQAIHKQLLQALSCQFPDNQWDVVNQAHVHQWYRDEDGNGIAPLTSVEHALLGWPETATAVALRLLADGCLELIAPFGLSDLLGMKLRCNPTLLSRASFEARLHAKQFLQRWPKLQLTY